MRSPRSAAVLLALLATVGVSACSGGGDTKSASPSPSPSASPTASPTPSPTPAPRSDPLTGLALVRGPVVALKVDNAPLARPYQRGLTQAAVVYQELVEGGSTRFLAVFESASATREVGPVRSARESDIAILRAYAKPALGFSGAQPGVFALVRSAARSGYLVDASYDVAPSLYRLGERRRDARNFFTIPDKIGERRGGGQPKDIGLRFGTTTAGVPTAGLTAKFSTFSVVRVRYSAANRSWVLSQQGRPIPVAPANVVIQYVTVKPSRFHDVHGMNTPLTITTGSGKAVVLRDGRRVVGTWKRTGYGVTRYYDATGHDILLRPGPTWVMLLPRSGGVLFS